ncbi:DUF5060 domain-containing protein [Ulvibacterium sp.]|uniref:DUF5060 domain-containing protein n=1 Tax=Ulvibacterium sp. TaxID=2665914 RepID=UPI003BA97B27
MRIGTLLFWILFFSGFHLEAQSEVEKWDIFELQLNGKKEGNPFTEIQLTAKFYHKQDTVAVSGFYDGNGSYKLRFMPDKEGAWRYITASNDTRLHEQKGTFQCIPPKNGNHGPVVVKDTFHFAYSDGKPFYPLGTTAYGWIQQNRETREKTLESLKKSPFNKIRVALLPHAPSGTDYELYPFEGKGKDWDFTRFNVAYFAQYEHYIQEMQKLGIQVDLFVFHPYDKGVWGFDKMNKKEQYLFLNYVNARFGAFRNIWWSMANEFDLMLERTTEDWDGYFRFFQDNDPYHRLRSIHNAAKWYDHSKPWVTHISAQSEAWWKSTTLRDTFKKPVLFDEFCYEGDGDNRTVALNGDMIRHRFWLMTILGAYATHGEAFNQQGTGYQFFRQGGNFEGSSAKELHALKKVLDDIPGHLKPLGTDWRLNWIRAGVDETYYLYYFGEYQNSSWTFTELPENLKYQVEVIDTKSGTTVKKDRTFGMGDKLDLPGKPYMAVVLRLVSL